MWFLGVFDTFVAVFIGLDMNTPVLHHHQFDKELEINQSYGFIALQII